MILLYRYLCFDLSIWEILRVGKYLVKWRVINSCNISKENYKKNSNELLWYYYKMSSTIWDTFKHIETFVLAFKCLNLCYALSNLNNPHWIRNWTSTCVRFHMILVVLFCISSWKTGLNSWKVFKIGKGDLKHPGEFWT